MSEEKREPTGWHLKKEIQVGHLLTSAVMAVGAIVYVGDIKRDVEVLKVKSAAQSTIDDKQDATTKEAIAQVREQLGRMDGKLDRLIEGGRR